MSTATKTKTTLTAAEKKALRTLADTAKQARGAYYSQEIEDASRELSRLLFKHYEQGVTFTTLGTATGMKWRSIKARLSRHGYLASPPSQQHKQFQGPKQAGPTCDHDKNRWRNRVNKKTGKVVHVECLDCRRNKRVLTTHNITIEASSNETHREKAAA